MDNAFEHVRELCSRVRAAAPTVAVLDHAARCAVLRAMARGLVANTEAILAANAADLASAAENGVPTVMMDRLKLTSERIGAIAEGVEALIALPDPLAGGDSWDRPSGLHIMRRRVM